MQPFSGSGNVSSTDNARKIGGNLVLPYRLTQITQSGVGVHQFFFPVPPARARARSFAAA